jgi:menaquinone-specific isochorismate synthase
MQGRNGSPGLHTLILPLDLEHIPVIGPLPPPFLVWARPDRQHYRIGLGTALQVTTAGKERFQHLQRYFERINTGWHCQSIAEAAPQPGAFCAFAFDGEDEMSGPWQGVANSLIAIPEVLLEFKEGQYTLSLSCQTDQLQTRRMQSERWVNHTAALLTSLLTGGVAQEHASTLYQAPSEPPNRDWLRLVAMARDAIRDQRMAKVVPARHLRIRGTRPFNETAILKRLAQHYPTCLLLGLSLGSKTLVAATPERLVSLRNGTISCDALGGTTERSGNPVQDNLLAHSLLQDPKTRHEHALVVDHLHRALYRVSAHVSIPDTPSVLPLGQLQHLWTPINAQCRPGTSLLDLAAALHPTPAVAGTPVTVANAWLAQHEPFKRGWYTGSIGWLQRGGNGELMVLLRSALLADKQADLYAGAGVVADSDPKKELAETELKLGAVIRALTDQQKDTDAHHAARP